MQLPQQFGAWFDVGSNALINDQNPVAGTLHFLKSELHRVSVSLVFGRMDF